MTIVISRILIGSALGSLPLNAMDDSDLHDDRHQIASGALHPAAPHRRKIVRRETPDCVRYRVSGSRAFRLDDRAFGNPSLGSAPNIGIDDYCDLQSTGCSTRY
jgi:hypothetical protein